jgi:hypothetical protein
MVVEKSSEAALKAPSLIRLLLNPGSNTTTEITIVEG